MRRRWNAGRGAVAIRVLGALVAVSGCLAAVAYAAKLPHVGRSGAPAAAATSQPVGPPNSSQRPKMNTRPPRPRIGQRPEATSTATSARFTFSAAGRRLRFECRLDNGRWKSCRSATTYASLAPGNHSFSVRTRARRGRYSAAAVYRWVLVEPKPFSIEPQLGDLAELFPGAGAVPLPVRLSNPNSVPIVVTSVRVGVSTDPPGCGSAANVELIPSSASSAAPLPLPAGGSLTLPGAGVSAPAIALRDLPVNQDACQGAEFPLVFTGEAHG